MTTGTTDDSTDAPNPWLVAGEHPGDRVLRAQSVRQGSLRGDRPPTPLQVAASLRSLADHTHIVHMLNVIVAQAALTEPGDRFNPPATSFGRYIHGICDYIEMTHDPVEPADIVADLRQQLASAYAEIAALRARQTS